MKHIIDKIEIIKGETDIIQIRTKKVEVLELANGETKTIDNGYHRFSASSRNEIADFPSNVKAEFEKHLPEAVE